MRRLKKQRLFTGFAFAAFAAFVLAVAGCGARECAVIRPGEVEVVLPEKALPVERFAAQELTNFLSRVLGGSVPIVTKAEKGRAVLLLGRASGFDVSGFERDAFRTKVECPTEGAATIRIAGCDSAARSLSDAVQESAYRKFGELAAKANPKWPDLIFFLDDYVALGALSAMIEKGVKMPDDVRVIACTNVGHALPFGSRFARIEFDLVRAGGEIGGFALERLHDRRNRTVVELELGEYAGGSAFQLCRSVP